MKKKIKNPVTRKLFLMFLSVCVLTASLAVASPAAAVQAASKSEKLQKTADRIIKKQTKETDSRKVKLRKLFKYAEKTYGYDRAIGFQAKKGWEQTFASEMYKKKKGSCYHFAAAYAVLAKKATGYPVRIGIGKTNGFNRKVVQPHAWTEVKIGSTWYICDTNMDKFAAKSSGKYYLKKRSSLKKTYNRFKGVKYTTVKW